jgi:hypothetical protein
MKRTNKGKLYRLGTKDGKRLVPYQTKTGKKILISQDLRTVLKLTGAKL